MQASVHLYESHQQASLAAAKAIASEIRRLIAERGLAVGIFSGEAALLDQLAAADAIEWTRVIGFHTFELLGAAEDAPHSQRKLLFDHLVRQVPMAEFHGLRGDAANPEAVCVNYSALLKSRPPDVAVLEIGKGWELAAIDSANCDFNDRSAVKLTDSAITLTIPVLLGCSSLFVTVSSNASQEAVKAAITGEVSPNCPASILQTHPNVHLFWERDSPFLFSS